MSFSQTGDSEQDLVVSLSDPLAFCGEYADDTAGALEAAANTGSKSVFVDLSSAKLINSTGINILLKFRNRLLAENRTLVLLNPTPFVREVIEAARLNRIFTCRDSKEQPLKA